MDNWDDKIVAIIALAAIGVGALAAAALGGQAALGAAAEAVTPVVTGIAGIAMGKGMR